MEFVKTFGLSPQLLLAQIVNFLILLYLLNRFVYKPVLKLLSEREERIKKGMQDAQRSEKLLEEATIREQKILRDARIQAQEIARLTKEDLQQVKQEFEEKLKFERGLMIKEAKEDINSEKLLMEKELMHKVSRIAIEMVEKVLRESIDPSDSKRIAHRAVKELTKLRVS